MLGAPLLLVFLVQAGDVPAEPPATFKPVAPAAPDGCRDELTAAGMRFSPWPLRPSHMTAEILCEAPEGVAITRGGAGVVFQPRARVNCAFAQRLVRFEAIVQEEARNILGGPVKSIRHLGTYNCRRMAAYPDWVSEHSFANAIDLRAEERPPRRGRARLGRRRQAGHHPGCPVPATADPPPLR